MNEKNCGNCQSCFKSVCHNYESKNYLVEVNYNENCDKHMTKLVGLNSISNKPIEVNDWFE